MLQMLKSRAAALAVDKGQRVLKEVNELIPTLRGLGLGLSDVSVKFGFPPEISASLTGSVASLDREAIEPLVERHRGNQTVTIVLEALITASHFREQIIDIGFNGLKLDIRLGMFPSVKLGLLPAAIPSTASMHGITTVV